MVWAKLGRRSPAVTTTSAKPLFSLAASSSTSAFAEPSSVCSHGGVHGAANDQPELAVLAQSAQPRRLLPLTVDVHGHGPVDAEDLMSCAVM